jgi:predicted AAA+ superfamily ATPase
MFERQLWSKLSAVMANQQSLVITGPRRVGKTTTLRWLLSQTQSANQLFLDLENLVDRRVWEKSDYDSIVEVWRSRGLDTTQPMFVAVDEIQFVPEITSAIKYLYDHYPVKFFLSGSSSYYLKNHFTESMAGRKFIFELMPLNFREYLRFRQINYQLENFSLLEPHFLREHEFGFLESEYDDFINWGGFPEVVLAKNVEDKRRLLTEIYSTYINQDVMTLADFKSSSGLRRLVLLLGARVGNRLNVNELAKVSGLHRETVNHYLEFLEATYLIKTLSVESNSADVKVRSVRKLYFVDTGIARINGDLSGGQKFENAVAAQLGHYGQLSYLDQDSREIDFIVRQFPSQDPWSVAIEVKETPVDTDERSLKRLAKRRGIKQAYLVGRKLSAKFKDYVWGGSLG